MFVSKVFVLENKRLLGGEIRISCHERLFVIQVDFMFPMLEKVKTCWVPPRAESLPAAENAKSPANNQLHSF